MNFPGRSGPSRWFALACAVVLLPAGLRAADTTEVFHQVEQGLDDAAFDLQGAPLSADAAASLPRVLEPLRPLLHDPAAAALLAGDASQPPAVQVGSARARLQHVAALEMLHAQQNGQLDAAREWRTLITLPRFASGEENAVLLQTVDPAQARQPAITKALAQEYIGWQSTRARQILDYIQTGVRRGDATAEFLALYGAEINALTHFPAALFADAELPAQTRFSPVIPALTAPFDTPPNEESLALWRQDVEGILPNLLTDKDVSRLQRLLARFVKLIPQEYRNGVSDGHILIALEYREATQFTQQAQALVNELGPVWQRDQPQAYAKTPPRTGGQVRWFAPGDCAHGTEHADRR